MTDPVPPLSIAPTESGFAVSGEIDAHTAPAVAAALAASNADRLVIDLSAVDFVDSSGLRVLIEAHQACQEAGRSLVLARPSAVVSRLFGIAGVDGYLDIDATTED